MVPFILSHGPRAPLRLRRKSESSHALYPCATTHRPRCPSRRPTFFHLNFSPCHPSTTNWVVPFNYQERKQCKHRKFVLNIMLSFFIGLLFASLPVFAQDDCITYVPAHNVTPIVGTWASGSQKVVTGPVSLSYFGLYAVTQASAYRLASCRTSLNRRTEASTIPQ